MQMISAILFTTVVLSNINCAEKEEVPAQECKTCKAYASGAGQQTLEEQVCSDAEETAFRNQYTGREITCR